MLFRALLLSLAALILFQGYNTMAADLRGTVIVKFIYLAVSSTFIYSQRLRLLWNIPIVRYTLLWMMFSPLVAIGTLMQGMSLLGFLDKMMIFFLWPTTFLAFFLLGQQKNFTKCFLRFLFGFFVALCVLFYYLYVNGIEELDIVAVDHGARRGILQSYYLLCLLPLWCCFNFGKKQFWLITLITLVILILSMKRTGVFACLAIIALYVFFRLRTHATFKYWLFWGSLGIVCVGPFYSQIMLWVEDDYQVFEYFTSRLDYNNIQLSGNTRSLYRNLAWHFFCDSSVFHWLFGYGVDGYTLYGPTRTSTHNDFLEILLNYGCVYFFLTLLFYARLITFYFRLKVLAQKCAWLGSLVILLSLSMYSHLLTRGDNFLLLTMFWGLVIGQFISIQESNGEVGKTSHDLVIQGMDSLYDPDTCKRKIR